MSISDALGLFPSVIKSGEPWTGTCQTVLDAACAEYRTLIALAREAEGLRDDKALLTGRLQASRQMLQASEARALKAEAERDAAREALQAIDTAFVKGRGLRARNAALVKCDKALAFLARSQGDQP